jgi:hypothetical protein
MLYSPWLAAERTIGGISMSTGIITHVGATLTLTKAMSEADVALFTLVTNDQPPNPDEPLPLDPMGRIQLPSAMLAAMLAVAASRHAGGLAAASIARADVVVPGVGWTGETLTTTAEVTAYDAASRTLRVRVQCANDQGQRLAEGIIDVRASA